jgi:hypothetical protein
VLILGILLHFNHLQNVILPAARAGIFDKNMAAAAIKVKINWNELRAYYSSGINEVFKGAFQLPLHEKGY